MNFSFWITAILTFITILGIVLLYQTLPPFLPLYNHMPWGYGRLGKTYEIFLPSTTVIFISIINITLGFKLMEKNPLLTRFLFVTMTILSVFSLIFVFKLIFLTL